MSDAAAKKGILFALIAGVILGAIAAVNTGYELVTVRAWNLVGLFVIAALSAFAVVAAVMGWRARIDE